MTTAEDVLSVARSQIGTVEDRAGNQKYGAFYGMNGVAWCAEFQWWIFNQAGAQGLIPKAAYTPTFYGWFQQKGQAGSQPRPGALVFFDWPDSVKRIQHVGIVEAVLAPGKIQTIEGNTTSGVAGNQSNGGGVWRRVRATTSVVGYGYPRYDGAPAPAPVVPAPTEQNHLPSLSFGMSNHPGVAALQRWSNDYDWRPPLPVVPPTGNYREQTRNLVKLIQQRLGVTGPDADGTIVGPRTNAGLWGLGFRG